MYGVLPGGVFDGAPLTPPRGVVKFTWGNHQFQSSQKLVRIWTVLRCIFFPNLEIVTSIGGELWHGQAKNGVNFDFGVQFDLEGQCQLSQKNNWDLNQVVLHLWFKVGDPSLNGRWVIARTNLVTDGRMDRGNDNTWRPKLASGKNDSTYRGQAGNPRSQTPQEVHLTAWPPLSTLNWYAGRSPVYRLSIYLILNTRFGHNHSISFQSYRNGFCRDGRHNHQLEFTGVGLHSIRLKLVNGNIAVML